VVQLVVGDGGDLMLRSLPKIHDSAFTRALANQMEHCEWAGFHFYDLIFPLFVFIVGVSIPFSIPRMIESRGLAVTVRRIVVRSVILFLLGIFHPRLWSRSSLFPALFLCWQRAS